MEKIRDMENMKEVKHIDVKENMKVSELIIGMKSMGFQAGKIARASEIMEEMFKDKECRIFFGVAGAMVPAGLRKIIFDVLDRIDVFVTTGANLTHDLIEALGEKHYKKENKEKEMLSDSVLREKGMNRIYNIFMENRVYEKLEKFFDKNWGVFKECRNIREFLWKIGELVDDNNSILKKCYEKKIPVFCPGIADSAIGMIIWGKLARSDKEKINVGCFNDMNEIMDIAWTSKKSGVIYIGGGVPKNFIQQAMQFSNKQGADYGIQITLDREEGGGSSGAQLKEGISWGKMSKKGKFVNVFCDATIALPLIWAGVKGSENKED